MRTPRRRNCGLRKLCGCPRRAWPKCGHAWHLNFKLRGGPSYRFSLDAHVGRPLKGKTEAEAVAEKIRIAIREGTFEHPKDRPATTPHLATTEVLTFEAFAGRYVDRCGRPVSANMRQCIRSLAAMTSEGVRFGDRPLAAITEDEIEALFARLRADGYSASYRNKFVQTIKALFRWAQPKGYLAEPHRHRRAQAREARPAQPSPGTRRGRPDDREAGARGRGAASAGGCWAAPSAAHHRCAGDRLQEGRTAQPALV
jgi:hypothetical protein